MARGLLKLWTMKMFSVFSLASFLVNPSLANNSVDLEEACGVRLRSRCPRLTRFIVGGSPSCSELAPWNALLEIRPRRRKRDTTSIDVLCGGSLVTSRHVVTAAHCIWSNRGSRGTCREPYISYTLEECKAKRCPRECWRVEPANLNVYLGLSERVFNSALPRPFGIKTISIHPSWDRFTALNNITGGGDLAVLTLDRPAIFSDTVWPICLPSPADQNLIQRGEVLDVHGFGIKDLEDRRHAEILQGARVRLVNTQICRTEWKVYGDQLCTVGINSSSNGRISDSCNGDSGGGVVAQRFDQSFVLVGLVSFGESDCGLARGRPSVNTNLLSHIPWIRNITNTNSRGCTTLDGRSCTFPFEFMGQVYTRCTRDQDPQNRNWCSTKTDSQGRHVEQAGEWGHCNSDCQTDIASSSLVTAAWAAWGAWSPCSTSCGPGKRVRMRECKSDTCAGNEVTSKTCNLKPCTASVTWGSWSSWSTCPSSCKGSRLRTRLCQKSTIANTVGLRDGSASGILNRDLDPRWANGAVEKEEREEEVGSEVDTCNGSGSESQRCSLTNCKINNHVNKEVENNLVEDRRRHWSSWSEYSSCSLTCSGGVKRRTRECQGNRGECFGSPTEIQPCGSSSCKQHRVGLPASNEVILLIGGWVGGSGQWLSNVTIVDGDSVCEGPRLPIWLADHFSTFVNNRVLTCGGRSGKDRTLCWTLDRKSSSWSRAPTMLTGRSYADAVAVGDKVWVSGGWDGSMRHASSEVLDTLDGAVFDAKDTDADSWRPGQHIGIRRYQHCGVGLLDGSVVLTGGQDGLAKSGRALASVEQYDVDSGFLRKLPNLQEARWTHGCAVYQSRGSEVLMVAGGRVTSGPGDELDSVEILVLGESAWRFVSSLPQPRLGPGLVVVGGRIVLTGGSLEIGVRRREERFPESILEYDQNSDRWRTVGEVRGRSHHAALALTKSLFSCDN